MQNNNIILTIRTDTSTTYSLPNINFLSTVDSRYLEA